MASTLFREPMQLKNRMWSISKSQDRSHHQIPLFEVLPPPPQKSLHFFLFRKLYSMKMRTHYSFPHIFYWPQDLLHPLYLVWTGQMENLALAFLLVDRILKPLPQLSVFTQSNVTHFIYPLNQKTLLFSSNTKVDFQLIIGLTIKMEKVVAQWFIGNLFRLMNNK